MMLLQEVRWCLAFFGLSRTGHRVRTTVPDVCLSFCDHQSPEEMQGHLDLVLNYQLAITGDSRYRIDT